MIELSSRAILNVDEVDEIIKPYVDKHPRLKDWLTKTFRSWVLKSGPARPSALESNNLPEFLRGKGSFNIELDKIAETLDSGVLDYLEYLSGQKGNKLRIGVDAAVKGSEKWHKELMRRKNANSTEIPDEEGTKLVVKLSDGYYVVQLMTSKAMENESDRMGNCVGRGYYHREYLSGKLDVYSIRDAQGGSHITFDCTGRRSIRLKDVRLKNLAE